MDKKELKKVFNLNAEYGLGGGNEQSYGGGFKWQF